MTHFLTKHARFCIALFIGLFVLGGHSGNFGREESFFHGYVIPKPVIRIGLGVNLGDVNVSASEGMKIYEIKTGYRLIADNAHEVMIEGARKNSVRSFAVQVTQAEDADNAAHKAQLLRHVVGPRVYVTQGITDRLAPSFQVRAGPYSSREDALNTIKILNQLGMNDAWILQEDKQNLDRLPLWIRVDSEYKPLQENTVLYFVPAAESGHLSFNRRDYRGIFVLKKGPAGSVLVNMLNLEDYLKAVVPSELSPYNFPAFEAHKAQAVAARTYAMKNIQINGDQDFDLCDTPKSQFYKGMSAEHPLSSRAVDETRGEAVLYKGRLIDALYTSTCGGITANVEEVFEGSAKPYLRSIVCTYDQQEEMFINSPNTLLPIYSNGRNIGPEIASLLSLRIIPRITDPAHYKAQAVLPEVWEWIQNIQVLLGKKRSRIIPESVDVDAATLARILSKAFGEGGVVLTAAGDPDSGYVLPASADIVLSESEAFKTGPLETRETDETTVPHLLTRGEAAYHLWRVVRGLDGLIHKGDFREYREGRLIAEGARGITEDIRVAPDAFLVKNQNGQPIFATHIALLGGENIRWIVREGSIRWLAVMSPAAVPQLEGYSSGRKWSVRKSREEMERRINRYYPIGELVDFHVQQRGPSHRVTELLIEAKDAQPLVKGFQIRRVLGLRETQFVIDRERDADGRITHFRISGKGRGHGVGLCQIGAFGMALSGSDYKTILKKYYTGITINKVF